MSSIAVPGLQLSTVLRLVAAPHLSIGFRVAPNITPQNLWKKNSCIIVLWNSYIIYISEILNIYRDMIYIYIYTHRWKDTVKQLTAQPWKSPKKVHLASLSSPTIRISLCCEQPRWEILLLYSLAATARHTDSLYSYNIYSTSAKKLHLSIGFRVAPFV